MMSPKSRFAKLAAMRRAKKVPYETAAPAEHEAQELKQSAENKENVPSD